MENSAATTLYDLLVTRDFEPEILDSQGKAVTDPAEAELFSFDYKTENKNYGTVVILLGANNNLEVYFGDNLGRTMEGDDKKDWYKFLAQIKAFATRNMLSFNLQNLKRLKYTMQGMAAIKEGLFEGYYGNRKMSYSDQPKKTRLVIKHSRDLGEGEARFRNIDRLFVETEDGARFPLAFKNLTGGKAMARHCSEGGTPYDTFGQHITEVVAEMNTLARFIRAAKRKQFDGQAHEMVEAAVRHYTDLKAKAKHMISQRGYRESRDTFDPAQIRDTEATVDSIRDMFVEQMLDQRIEEALPVLAKLKGPEMREADEFESWTNSVTEGTWALPDDTMAQDKLKELMSKPLIVGVDAMDATEQLYDLIGDDILFDKLGDLADKNPDANVWDDPDVMARISELVPELEFSQETDEALQGAPFGGALNMPMEEDELDEIDMNTVTHAINALNPVTGALAGAAIGKGIEKTVNYFQKKKQDKAYDNLKQQQQTKVARDEMDEDLDTDGVMMTKPSNMSSESVDPLIRLRQLSKL